MSGGDWKTMFKAIQDGDIELVKYYLRMGIDPNYQHPEFMASPLIESIRFNEIEIMRLLLNNGANPQIKEYMEGVTPMEVAQKANNTKAIKILNQFIVS